MQLGRGSGDIFKQALQGRPAAGAAPCAAGTCPEAASGAVPCGSAGPSR